MTKHLVGIRKFLSYTPSRWEATSYHQSKSHLDMAFLSALADRLLAHNLHPVLTVADMEQIQRSIQFPGRPGGSRTGRGVDLWVAGVPELYGHSNLISLFLWVDSCWPLSRFLVLPTLSSSLILQLVLLHHFACLSLPHSQSFVMHNTDLNIKLNGILAEYEGNRNIVG